MNRTSYTFPINSSVLTETSLELHRVTVNPTQSTASKIVATLQSDSSFSVSFELFGTFSFSKPAPTSLNDISGSMSAYKLYFNGQLGEEVQYASPVALSPRVNPPLLDTYSGNDTIVSAHTTAKNDEIFTYGGNDRITPGLGDDYVNGGSGIDTVVLSGRAADYTLQVSRDVVTTRDARANQDGSDTFVNVERLQFSDKKVAVDLVGNAGQTLKILNAIFGASSVSNKEYVGIGLSYLDGGMSYSALVDLALTVRFGAGYSVETMLNTLHTNTGFDPVTTAEIAFWQARNDLGMSKSSIAEIYVDSQNNVDQIDIAGLARTGVEYI